VVLMDGSLAAAEESVNALVSELNGFYTVYLMRRPADLSLRVSTGIAEYRNGESADDLFARADQAMYGRKGKKPSTGASEPELFTALHPDSRSGDGLQA
jgi:PleD family two-component response regulator